MSQEIKGVLAEAARGEESRRQRARLQAQMARRARFEAEQRKREEAERQRELREFQQRKAERDALNLLYLVEADQRMAALNEGVKFFNKYLHIYNLRLKSIENGTHDKFEKLLEEAFGFPWSKLAFSPEELKALPGLLRDRQGMNLVLSLGLWPFERPPAPIVSSKTGLSDTETMMLAVLAGTLMMGSGAPPPSTAEKEF